MDTSMFNKSPCFPIAIFVSLALLSGNVHSQPPAYPLGASAYPQFAPPSTGVPQQPAYTIPVGPTYETNIDGYSEAPVGDLEPMAVNPADQISVANQISDRGVKSMDVKPATAMLGNVEQLGVEPASAGLPGGDDTDACDCSPSGVCRADCPNRRPGIHALNKRGTFVIGGWLEQGFTANFSSPNNRENAPVLFNDRSNDYRLNQLYFFAEKSVLPNRRKWDLGGRIDVLLGTDARFLTVPGLEQHQDRTPKWNSETDDYGIAIPQAYVNVAVPWRNGVSIKAGHFYSPAGYETAAAPENFFYSHSYTYLYGEPFTFTGALLTSQPNNRVKWQLGYTNGWDVFDSPSDEYGILAGLTLLTADQRTSLAATMTAGKDVTMAVPEEN